MNSKKTTSENTGLREQNLETNNLSANPTIRVNYKWIKNPNKE
jgi:hypothetical protein